MSVALLELSQITDLQEELKSHIKDVKDDESVTNSYEKEIIRRIMAMAQGGLEIDLDDDFFDFMAYYPGTLTDGSPYDPRSVAQEPLTYVVQRLLQLKPTTIAGAGGEIINPFDCSFRIKIIPTNNQEIFIDPRGNSTSKRRRRWIKIIDNPRENLRTIYIQVRDPQIESSSDLTEIFHFLGILHLLRKANYQEIACFLGKNSLLDYFCDEESFKKFKSTPISVQVDFEGNRRKATQILADQIKGVLSQEELVVWQNNPPILLVGNDFSLRLTIFTLIIDENQLNHLANLYRNDLKSLKQLLKQKRIPPDLHSFIEKFFLLQRLYTDEERKNNEKKNELFHQIFSAENYQRLGFRRILYGITLPNSSSQVQQSLMAEPVDYWRPGEVDPLALRDEEGLITGVINGLDGISILSIPYVIGHLCQDLVLTLIDEGLVNPKIVGFIGKVGHGTTQKNDNPLEIGDLVSLNSCYDTAGNQLPFPGQNSAHPFIRKIPVACLTVPGVLLQSFQDIANVEQRQPGIPVVLDMEQYHLAQAFKNPPIIIASCFYVSDISQRSSNGQCLNNRKITQSIDKQNGAIAASLATLDVLNQLGQISF